MEFVLATWETTKDTLRDVLPIAVILFSFQFFVLRRPLPEPRKLMVGFAFVILGLSLFLLGLEQALFPIGRLMAEQLTHHEFTGVLLSNEMAGGDGYFWIYVFAIALGFSTTIAEPALMAIAIKAEALSGGAIRANGLRIAVAVGVAIGLAIGVWRIVLGTPIQYFIITGYIVVVVQTLFAPRMIIALAYDSGGVTTSTVTVPLVAALGLGLAESIPGRSPLIDGFGLVAFASLFPIMAVMAYAQFSEWRAARQAKTPEGQARDFASTGESK
jgi:hypothetical protein